MDDTIYISDKFWPSCDHIHAYIFADRKMMKGLERKKLTNKYYPERCFKTRKLFPIITPHFNSSMIFVRA